MTSVFAQTATARRQSATRRLAQASVATKLQDAAVLYHQSRALLHHVCEGKAAGLEACEVKWSVAQCGFAVQASKPEAALAIAQASTGVGDNHPWLWFNVASVHASMNHVAYATSPFSRPTRC